MLTNNENFTTSGGIAVERRTEPVDPKASVAALVDALDERKGVLLSSTYDYPGRYTRWDLGLKDPLLEFVSRGRELRVCALNERGRVLLSPIGARFAELDCVEALEFGATELTVAVRSPGRRFTEEERSRQPSVFSLLRATVELFHCPTDAALGLYGAFGYDLAFQFESIALARARAADQRDLVLYLPDELLVVDHQKQQAFRHRYEFCWNGESTRGRCATPYPVAAVTAAVEPGPACDHGPGEYAAAVRRAQQAFKRGDLFELVLAQTFREPCARRPSQIFRWLREHNPAPYALLLNLGQAEHLVGASPEMYVRVEGRRVETCPISGTIARGRDAIEDAERIRELLNSAKDESELSMCTDVDRNDKARICQPGSVRVIGRRQIELYSRVIHTVDHVEGSLRPGFDALDAFLSHAWAVTVTGAPKPAAIAAVELEEKSPRGWYAGAIGRIGFDGNLNTGLTLRTVMLKNGIAELRAGATLLYDSDPELEERETRLKASAFLDAVRGTAPARVHAGPSALPGRGQRVLLFDHDDSFVHSLADYFRQTGADVVTSRREAALELLDTTPVDLVVLSPGPGTPSDFQINKTIASVLRKKIPLFGVCLGLQGIAEYFGGKLRLLDYPMHGKPSRVSVSGGRLLAGLGPSFVAGRYHSIFVERETFPSELVVTAEADNGVVMALEHRSLPVAAVQFHPESILTLAGQTGLKLVHNVMASFTCARPGGSSVRKLGEAVVAL
ncbi:MAG: anthranilate synthase component I [Deltaproteobacteria bacterium]